MRNLALAIGAYLLLVLFGPLWRITPFTVVAPNLAVIFATYLGITARGPLAGPTAWAVVIGYLADLLGGSPPGLMAFAAGAACVGARVFTTRLLVRGRVFAMGLTGVLTLLVSMLVAMLAAYHGQRTGPWFDQTTVALGSAMVTGLLAAPVFRMLRNLDARFARTEREREAVREGYMN